jgi:8-oxo-dGTP diphosphatase
MHNQTERKPIAAVGIVCFRGDEVLLIRRATPPLQGRWSIPGGRIEWGERAAHAALRELNEETGVRAELVGLIDVVDALLGSAGAPSPSGAARPHDVSQHYILIDYAARWLAGEPRPGDDASEAAFFAPDQIPALGLWDETSRIVEAGRARLYG